MKTKITIAWMISMNMMIGSSVFAAESYKLTCRENGISFEVPLVITVMGMKASAQGEFSGPGDGFFQVDYKNLRVNVAADSLSELEYITISDAKNGKAFDLSIKSSRGGGYVGTLKMISSDDQKQPWAGEVSCRQTFEDSF